MLREVTVKIGLESIDIQEQITVEVLLDSGETELVISSEFTRKQGLKTKKMKNIYYQVHKWWTYFFFILFPFSFCFLTFLFLEHRISVSDGHESQDA